MAWDALGGRALEATQSNKVFCFGGGATIAKEYEHKPADVDFVCTSTHRIAKGKDEAPVMEKEMKKTVWRRFSLSDFRVGEKVRYHGKVQVCDAEVVGIEGVSMKLK